MKRVINYSVTAYNEIIIMSDNMSIDSINNKTKHKTKYYIFNIILLVTIRLLLLIIIVMNGYYIKLQLK